MTDNLEKKSEVIIKIDSSHNSHDSYDSYDSYNFVVDYYQKKCVGLINVIRQI